MCIWISAQGGQSGNRLMMTQGQSILEMPLTQSGSGAGSLILQIPGQMAVGIDVDCHEKYVYWTDVMGKVIHKAKLDGTDSQIVLKGEHDLTHFTYE